MDDAALTLHLEAQVDDEADDVVIIGVAARVADGGAVTIQDHGPGLVLDHVQIPGSVTHHVVPVTRDRASGIPIPLAAQAPAPMRCREDDAPVLVLVPDPDAAPIPVAAVALKQMLRKSRRRLPHRKRFALAPPQRHRAPY